MTKELKRERYFNDAIFLNNVRKITALSKWKLTSSKKYSTKYFRNSILLYLILIYKNNSFPVTLNRQKIIQ